MAEGGRAVPLGVMWDLTRMWYSDRLDPDFQRRGIDEYQAMLTAVGLTDDFWQLA